MKTNNVPVVFIHRGDGGGHVPCAINQAKVYNKEVILLGDESNKKLSNICTHKMISDYSNISNEFLKVYVPLSTHGDYETFCFQRWFVLYEWMKAEKRDVVLYLDSDIMLYADATKEYNDKFQQFALTLVHKCVGSNCYTTYEGLKDFCKFTYETYQQKQYEFDRIAAHYHTMQKYHKTGGVCDMTYLEYYGRYINPAGTGELMYIINDSVYDHCISMPDKYYEMENGIKKVQFIDKLPYVKRFDVDKLIRFNTLHFQGGSKTIMGQFYKP